MFVINVFGLGVLYRVLELPTSLVTRIEQVAHEAKMTFSDVFFDFELMERCGFFSFMELPVQTEGIGCMIHKDNLFEIRKERKKIKHFSLDDLVSENYLFPMYHTKSDELEVRRSEGFHYFFLYQVIKGRVLKYLLDSFQGIDTLEFVNTKFSIENQSFELLTGVNLDGECLVTEADDSVVVEQRVLKL